MPAAPPILHRGMTTDISRTGQGVDLHTLLLPLIGLEKDKD